MCSNQQYRTVSWFVALFMSNAVWAAREAPPSPAPQPQETLPQMIHCTWSAMVAPVVTLVTVTARVGADRTARAKLVMIHVNIARTLTRSG